MGFLKMLLIPLIPSPLKNYGMESYNSVYTMVLEFNNWLLACLVWVLENACTWTWEKVHFQFVCAKLFEARLVASLVGLLFSVFSDHK